MPSDNPIIGAAEERKQRGRTCARFGAIEIVVMLLIGIVSLAVIIPAFQTTGRRPFSQAWRNIHQIALSLENYHSKHGAYPYDSRGPDYALYLLYIDAQANGWTLDAKFFDSYPHEQPSPDARWDHAAHRIVDSDFDYWNNPELDDAHLQGCISGCPAIVAIERPAPRSKVLLLATIDARIRSCQMPAGDYRKLFGTLWTSDCFLIANRELFDEWEEVGFPRGTQETSVWSGPRVDHRIVGNMIATYAYRGENLIGRNWTLPTGIMISESVTTDEIGRITGFTRQPTDWRTFWPGADRNHEE